MSRTQATAEFERLATPLVEAMGFSLVRVMISGSQRPKLQVMMERSDGRDVTIDDCANMSRALSAHLDVEDPVPGTYILEVSSPGLDRPLVRLADFERFAGREAKLETTELIDGRRRYRGTLQGVLQDRVRIAVEGKDLEIPFAAITSAKLLLTDEIIAASLKRQNPQNP